jgi:SAM-dependent methyltransferase
MKKNMKNDVICPLCSENVELMYTGLQGYQEPEKFDIYHCSSCNTSHSSPQVNADGIYNLIYKNGAVAPGYHRYWKYSLDIKNEKKPLNYLANQEMTYWATRKAVLDYSEKNKNPVILEVGSGLGYLTYAFRYEGYNITGLDVSETAVNIAKERYGDYYVCDDLYKYAVEKAGTFDIVLLTEVIEHVHDVMSFIAALSNLLKPHGQIIMTTPNKSFYPDDTIWVSDLPPIHCWWLSEESIKYIAGKMNLNVSFIDFSDFYKKNYTPMRIDVNKKIPGRRAVFNENGVLLKSKNKSFMKKAFQALGDTLIKLKIVDVAYVNLRQACLKLRYQGNPNIKVCGSQTHILCALLTFK